MSVSDVSASEWLDPAIPRVAFVFKLPFDVDPALLRLQRVFPYPRESGRHDLVAVHGVSSIGSFSDAPFKYTGRWLGLLEGPGGAQPILEEQHSVMDVETDNVLPLHTRDMGPEEALFTSALATANRFVHAYMAASEDPAVRFVTPEALEPLASVEFRDLDGSILASAAMPLSSAYRDNDRVQHGRELLARLDDALHAESHGHPIDEVVLWRVRAEHLVNYVGEYELGVVALQTSLERLVYAVRVATAVDLGLTPEQTRSLRSAHFKQVLTSLAKDLGGNWDLKAEHLPVGGYWHDLYALRNRVGHAGRRIDVGATEAAFRAYERFLRFLEQRVLVHKSRFPRTALMLFSAEGLRRQGHLSPPILSLIRELRANNSTWGFWEP